MPTCSAIVVSGTLSAAGSTDDQGPLTSFAVGGANFFIHIGVERIGRYLQVFYEERAGSIGWETTAMNFGAKFPARGLDPLFSVVFFSAGALNFFNALATSELRSGWTLISLAAHLAFNYRIVRARFISATQRAIDLDAFRSLANH